MGLDIRLVPIHLAKCCYCLCSNAFIHIYSNVLLHDFSNTFCHAFSIFVASLCAKHTDQTYAIFATNGFQHIVDKCILHLIGIRIFGINA